MGFFSWKCSKSHKSIPAYPYAEKPKALSEVVLVLPDNRRITGTYGGYGDIKTETGEVDVYEEIAKFLPGYDGSGRDFVFNRRKRWICPKGIRQLFTTAFSWEDKIPETDMTMNEMKAAGWTYSDNFKMCKELIKIVRASEYSGEDWKELPPSEDCPSQGFFYESQKEWK